MIQYALSKRGVPAGFPIIVEGPPLLKKGGGGPPATQKKVAPLISPPLFCPKNVNFVMLMQFFSKIAPPKVKSNGKPCPQYLVQDWETLPTVLGSGYHVTIQ